MNLFNQTNIDVCSTVVKFKMMVILTFKIKIEKGMGKSTDEMECFTGALLDVTVQQRIKCEFN